LEVELLDGDEEELDEEEEALGMMKREVLRVAWDLWRKGVRSVRWRLAIGRGCGVLELELSSERVSLERARERLWLSFRWEGVALSTSSSRALAVGAFGLVLFLIQWSVFFRGPHDWRPLTIYMKNKIYKN
jgi:hypothetical protein